MLLHIPGVLSTEQVKAMRHRLDTVGDSNIEGWVDGRVTAGHQGQSVKRNQQLAEQSALAQMLGGLILAELERHPLFISATLPSRVYPPMFNRYGAGMAFGNHVDGAIRLMPGTGAKLRTDVSATLFLTDPDDYDGGELLIEDTFGAQAVKLPAGDMVIYPSNSVHRVSPVTRGERVASFFWIESMVRDDAQRTLLFDLDQAIQGLNPACVQLTGTYHNLLRMWAST